MTKPTHEQALRTAMILNPQEYQPLRRQRQQAISALRKQRRVTVGPHVTVYFENYETVAFQIQEMLYIEGGGAQQLEDELAAYLPLIPGERQLTATLMIEIPDPIQRRQLLAQWGHLEDQVFLHINGINLHAKPVDPLTRTTEDGKTSAVHFLKFDFTAGQVQAFLQDPLQVQLEIRHNQYTHQVALSLETIQALRQDVRGNHSCEPIIETPSRS